MKKCSICNLEKDENDFYQKKYRKKNELRSDCKDCAKKRVAARSLNRKHEISVYKKKYYSKNHASIESKRKEIKCEKKDLIKKIKDNPCCDCGKRFESCVMDFDHRDQKTKKRGIAIISNGCYSVEILNEELKKCDLVCACCHRNRTYELWQKSKSQNKRAYPSREIKKQFIDNLKTGKPCADCNQIFNTWQMDFDHIKDQKKFKVSDIPKTKCSFEEIIEEVNKCELVCVNCHRIRTQLRK